MCSIMSLIVMIERFGSFLLLHMVQKTDTDERGPQSYLDEADQIYQALQRVGLTEDGKSLTKKEVH